MILWDEKYKTGDEMIDNQHKQLFEFFNDFEEVIKEGRGESFIQNSLEFIENYIDCHFGIEELCMFKHKCQIAGKNQLAHENFRKTFVEFKNKINASGNKNHIANEMHHYIEEWIKNHIIGIDTHLKDSIV